MKLCSIISNGVPCVGVLTDGGIADVTALGYPSRMNSIIEGGESMLARIAAALQAGDVTLLREGEVKFLPVTEPEKIICAGLNYSDHAAETGKPAPGHPVFFNKFADSLSAHGEPVTLPPWLEQFDYEAELVIVIGRRAYNVSIEDARACVFGYSCGNDLTSRAAQSLSSQWLSGKAIPGFAPVGPYIVTSDGLDPCKPHGVFCDVNGERVQSGASSDMIFPCHELISTASRFFPLSPGDLIFTGTPAGVIVGRRKEDRTWLKPGDVVEITIDGIGTLKTPLV